MLTEEFEKTIGAVTWQLGLGDLAGELHWIAPDAMAEYRRDADGDTETEIWRGHPEAGRDFQVKVVWRQVEPTRREGRISWSGYEGKRQIEEIHFPVVSTAYRPGSRFFFGGAETGQLYDPAVVLVLDRRRHISMMCNALLDREGWSLYFDHRDPRHAAKYACYEVNEGEFRCWCVHGLACGAEPAAEYELPYANSVGIFRGGWYEAAQIYRRWALEQPWAAARRGRPNPLADLGIWVWNRGPADEVVPPVLALQEDLGEVPVAMDWYWWHHNSYDTDYPDFWPPRDGEEKFRAAIAEMRARGIFTQVYINALAWDVDTPSYADGGAESVVVTREGKPFAIRYNVYTGHRLGYMCGEAPRFHDRISRLVKRLHSCGLDGQYLDQVAIASYRQCYNPHHSHGGGASAENVEGYRRQVKRLIAENPGWPFTSEGCNEAFMDLFEGGIACAALSGERIRLAPGVEYVPVFQAVYHGDFAVFGNYAMPDAIPPWDPLWPDKDRWRHEEPWHRLFPEQFFVEMARGCVWGIQPMVCNLTEKIRRDPEFAEEYRFILETARFYHANRDLLFSGTMLSPEGFSCADREVGFLVRTIYTKERRTTSRHLPAVLHGCWRSPTGECALVLANYTREPQRWRYGALAGEIPARSYARIALPAAAGAGIANDGKQ